MPPKILTPQSAIDRVLASKAQSKKLTLYDTPLEKTLLLLTATLAALGSVVGAGSYFLQQYDVALVGVSLVLASAFAFIGYQLASLIPELLKLRNPERDFISPHALQFNDDIDLISSLATDHEPQHLQYAAQSFALSADHLRSRIALLVGAIDKVGIVPLGVTTYFSASKLLREGMTFGGVEWFLIALIFLYLFAIRMSLVAQWLERIALIYRAAVAVQQRSALSIVG